MNSHEVYSIKTLRDTGMRFCFEIMEKHGLFIEDKWNMVALSNIKSFAKLITNIYMH
jgi:hypothetical protein